MRPKSWPNSFVYLLVLAVIVATVFAFLPSSGKPQEVGITEFITYIKQGEIDHILQKENTLTGSYGEEERYTADYYGTTNDLVAILSDNGVNVGEGGISLDVKASGIDWGMIALQILLPIMLIGALFYFLFRSARGAGTQAFNFGKSRARLSSGNKPTVTFADVAGADEAKEEVQEVVEYLKSPQKFHALGARIPRGVLLVGPPGTGKTLLAKAIAGEANVPFYSISGSEFVEMFVGVGAARVRDLFEQAKRNAPCIVFMDEIDAVGRHRGAGLGGGHDEREQTLNQILSEMDGFDTNANVIVIAATNRPDILDPALLRPGRFDRHIVVDLPDINGRKAILEVHAKGKSLDKEVNLETIAKETPGFSGADLANLINEAAILAARRDRKDIFLKDLEDAVDRVIAGPEKKSRVISQREKEITAYHESGHALTANMLPNADATVHKISIIARGMAEGWTRFLPSEDRHIYPKSQLVDTIAILLGGRAAEEITFNEVTTGAQKDLSEATKLARKMVTEYGMSDKLGPRTFGQRQELVFLGREISEQRDYSDKIAQEIDEEVHDIIQRAYNTAKKILTKNKAKLKQIAEELIAHETLEESALNKLFQGLTPQPASA
ncbi:MAG: ATP-dependent zinc metalloprotease FtsH [Dehalococcoidia bacterium]|nr:ATP-dependent zinc metalloprotease FtsH [Dehalococcoidia bacterium]MDH5780950.1 ATP-dependent zinc metalloprotease FtsH [Dehalococcoidia bacterium]